MKARQKKKRQKKKWLKCKSEKDEKIRVHPEIPKFHQFQEEYICTGFTTTCSDPPLALGFFCGEKLANSCIKHRPMFLIKL